MALEYGYVDAAIVGEELLKVGMERHAIGEVYWSPDFLPMVFPIAVVMNRWNDLTFGGQLGQEITEGCGHIISEYGERTLNFWKDLPQTAAGSGVRVLTISDDDKQFWTHKQVGILPFDFDSEVDYVIRNKYGP